jgi:hypothetical protein
MAQEPRSLFPAIIFLYRVEGIYEEKSLLRTPQI